MYDGEYGADETCPCGMYYKSCPLHSMTGPNPKPGDTEKALERRKCELAALQQKEIGLHASYDNLSPEERAVADALWNKDFLISFPGVDSTLPNAVKGRADSWIVGEARAMCRRAKITAVAVGCS